MKLPGIFRRRERRTNPVRRNLIHSGGVMALITLVVASGAGVSYAYWTSQATTTSAVQSGQIAVTTNLAALNAFAFDNNLFTAHGSFTVTNTTLNTTRPMPVSSQLSAVITPAAQDANLTVAVWQDTIACTVTQIPEGATTGLWSTISAVSVNVAPGASATFCVRVVDGLRTQLDGGPEFTITPTVTSTIEPNATSGWVASASFTATALTAPVTPATVLSCAPSGAGNILISWGYSAAGPYQIYVAPPNKLIGSISNQPGIVLSGADTGNWDIPNGNGPYITIQVRYGQSLQEIEIKNPGNSRKLSCR